MFLFSYIERFNMAVVISRTGLYTPTDELVHGFNQYVEKFNLSDCQDNAKRVLGREPSGDEAPIILDEYV